jgi:hypothetical protein
VGEPYRKPPPAAWANMLFRAMLRGVMTAAFASAFALACGASRPAFDGTVFRHGTVAFRVPKVPGGWTRMDVTDAALAFRDAANDGSVLVNARCGEKDGDAPLVALTNQLVMGTTERTLTTEETMPFDGREARHTRMTAKLDGVLRDFDIFVLKKDGCVYDFVYVSAPEHAAAGAPEFEGFVKGFHTVGAEEP